VSRTRFEPITSRIWTQNVNTRLAWSVERLKLYEIVFVSQGRELVLFVRFIAILAWIWQRLHWDSRSIHLKQFLRKHENYVLLAISVTIIKQSAKLHRVLGLCYRISTPADKQVSYIGNCYLRIKIPLFCIRLSFIIILL
jgi:hypothetical protein